MIFLWLDTSAFPHPHITSESILESGLLGLISIGIIGAISRVIRTLLPNFVREEDEFWTSLKKGVGLVVRVYCLLLVFFWLINFFFVQFLGFIIWSGVVNDDSASWLMITIGIVCLVVAIGHSIFVIGRCGENNTSDKEEASSVSVSE